MESLAAIESEKSSVLLGTILKEFLNCQMDLSCCTDVVVFCDYINLVDAVYSSTHIENKRLFIEICVLRDMISLGEIKNFCWIHTDFQIVTCLTKQGAPTYNLLNVLNEKITLNIRKNYKNKT